MIVMIPVTADGSSDPRFGRAPLVAVAEVDAAQIGSWQVHEVGWDVLHDSQEHGAHHATVMKFLKEHRIEAVVSAEMGAGMARMMKSAKLPVLTVAPGVEAKAAVLAALADPEAFVTPSATVIQLS
jgi:predicted Fe-Mo cluster-binding NifX family protein